MGRTLLGCAALALVLSWPGEAAAQDASSELAAPIEEPRVTPALRAEAHHTARVGLGLSLSGFGTIAFGAALFAVPFAAIAGFVFAGLGAAAMLTGVPIWIAADVRDALLRASDADRPALAAYYETCGIATTILGIVMSLAGGGLLIGGILSTSLGSHRYDDHAGEAMRGWGAAFIPVGALVALFIGVPMWAEGARF